MIFLECTANMLGQPCVESAAGCNSCHATTKTDHPDLSADASGQVGPDGIFAARAAKFCDN
jgi:hypothetical protein